MPAQIHGVDRVPMRGQILTDMAVARTMFGNAMNQHKDRLGLTGTPALGVESHPILGF